MRTETNNTVDLTSRLENIERGEGFYSTFMSEQQRISRPARKSINGLKELFALLSPPCEEPKHEDKGLSKLSQLIKKVLSIYESSEPKEFLRKLKKRLLKLCDKMKSERVNDIYNPAVETALQIEPNPISMEEGLNDEQKNEIYNMLLANGVSHEEALNELLKY